MTRALAASTVKSWGTKKQKAEMMEDGKLKKRLKSTSTEAETDGVPMGDVWDIGILAPSGKERVGYPTQKPEALLERLVGALSDAGELILDPCAGSGTTLAVAAKMGRRFIGIDSSPVAVETMRVGWRRWCRGSGGRRGTCAAWRLGNEVQRSPRVRIRRAS